MVYMEWWARAIRMGMVTNVSGAHGPTIGIVRVEAFHKNCRKPEVIYGRSEHDGGSVAVVADAIKYLFSYMDQLREERFIRVRVVHEDTIGRTGGETVVLELPVEPRTFTNQTPQP